MTKALSISNRLPVTGYRFSGRAASNSAIKTDSSTPKRDAEPLEIEEADIPSSTLDGWVG